MIKSLNLKASRFVGLRLRVSWVHTSGAEDFIILSEVRLTDTLDREAMSNLIGLLSYHKESPDAFRMEYGDPIYDFLLNRIQQDTVFVGGVSFVELIGKVCKMHGLSNPFKSEGADQ